MAGKRLVFAVIGAIAAAIAIIGVWLPGIPTTFPLIVALWAFGKSYPKLSAWLSRVPVLRTALREVHRFERERTVSRSAKIIAQVSAWVSVIVVWIVTQNIVVVGFVCATALGCSVFMVRVPTSGRRVESRQEA